MVPPLLISLMLKLDFLILLTKVALQKISIVDWLSESMTYRRSSLIVEPAFLKIFVILGLN
jgi:hypothetical protein